MIGWRSAVARAVSGLGLAVGLGVVFAPGCSALVTSTLEDVSCSQEGAIGPPACPGGQMCHAGQCTACAPKDLCGDGVDNDCNGSIDDGCGDAGLGGSAGSGGIGGAPTGGTGGDVGGTGGVAGATGGASGTGATGGTGGSDASVPGKLGSTCSSDSQCDPGLFCSDPAAHGMSGGTMICMSGCCTTKDCQSSPDSVCFPTQNGYGLCVPAAQVGRTVGSKLSGSGCSADSECRTGVCEGGSCVDTCCADGDCAGSNKCTFKPLKGTSRMAFMCGAAPGSGGFQYPCITDDSACTSNICLGGCTKPCCSRNDCAGIGSYSCFYFDKGSDRTRACYYLGPPGSAATGQPCTADSQCQSQICLLNGSTGTCTDTCCDDSDCGDPTKVGCRPRNIKNFGTLLLCVPLQ